MTASEFARLLHARRLTRGKWQAKCPAHPDHKPSLSIAEGKKGVLIRCMSAGCDTRDILKALGLTFSDLFYTSRQMTPELRRRLDAVDVKENLERQLGLVIMLGAVEPGRKNYWAAAEKRIRRELELVRCKVEPEAIYREFKERHFQHRLARLGWDGLWAQISNREGSHATN